MSATGTDIAVVDADVKQRAAIYAAPGNEDFRQGEILSNVFKYDFDPVTGDVDEILLDYAIIFSQDCDLLQDYNNFRDHSVRQLRDILLFEVQLTSVVRGAVAGSDIWKRLIQNKDERYHAFEAAPPGIEVSGVGLPDLIVDFKHAFSINTGELYRQCGVEGGAVRRCRLAEPYREHFQGRAAFYLQRVTLPEPHRISPVPK